MGKAEDGKRKVVVTLTIADSWHIYANPVGNENLIESQTDVILFVDGKTAKTKVNYPKGEGIHRRGGGEVQRVRW